MTVLRSKRKNRSRKEKAFALARKQKLASGGRDECPTPWKEPYVSRKVARTRLQSSPRQHGERLSVYRCLCGRFHVGKLLTESREHDRLIADRKMAQKKGPSEDGP